MSDEKISPALEALGAKPKPTPPDPPPPVAPVPTPPVPTARNYFQSEIDFAQLLTMAENNVVGSWEEQFMTQIMRRASQFGFGCQLHQYEVDKMRQIAARDRSA